MNSLFNCWWYFCTCEIEWLSVVVIESMCQKIICMNMLCFCEKWWIMKLSFDELGMKSWLFVVGVVLECVVDELMHWVS